MSYISLYRKFRPDTFSEVKGQEHIVTTLQNQLQYDRVGHAYLFCGTRGTGKTTVAKILAKAVNCEHPVNGNPCGECESCRRLAMGAAMNVVEIDAASNNGVDNIRDINAAVQYPPAEGKYIVYIIDEVHMLSTGAFNALLKTLEEPPSYVIFILATTEDMKVPVTIKSRCQRYDFHRISVETITGRLAELMQREGITAEPEALRYIAQAADGSMRDALSILEECVSASLGEDLTFDNVLKQVGAVDVDVYMRLLDALQTEKADELLEIVNDAVWKGRDLSKFTDDMVWFVRNVLFLKMAPGVGASLELTGETQTKLLEAGKTVSEETLVRYLRILQELSVSIRNSTIRRITLEMGLIRMMKPESDRDYEAVIGRLERLEEGAGILDPASGAANNAGAAGSSGNAGAAGNPGNATAAGPSGKAVAEYVSPVEIRRIIKETMLETVREAVEEKLEEYTSDGETGGGETPPKKLRKKTPEELDRLVRNNLKESLPPATEKEVLEMTRNWNTVILPKLDFSMREHLLAAELQPDVIEGEKPGFLILVRSKGKSDGNAETLYDYFLDKSDIDKLEYIAGVAKEVMQRDVRIRVEKRVSRGDEDESEFRDLQKIQFHVDMEE